MQLWLALLAERLWSRLSVVRVAMLTLKKARLMIRMLRMGQMLPAVHLLGLAAGQMSMRAAVRLQMLIVVGLHGQAGLVLLPLASVPNLLQGSDLASLQLLPILLVPLAVVVSQLHLQRHPLTA